MKRLVLCCDGTWNRADQAHDGTPCPTNVVKLAYRVAKRDQAGVPQVVFYDQGVGTGNAVDRLSGGAFGDGLEDNICDAYRFLVANYEPGDELYLFGFSRGAFTARSVAGMVRKCGILDRTAIHRYTEARALYHRADVRPDDEPAVRFRTETSCRGAEPTPIRCIGVWDTVGALGIPVRGLRSLTAGRYAFHDTELSGSVEYGFHALAIDEHRAPFAPTLWLEKPKPNQTVRQVWFPGVHSDVGGGYPETALSDITLQWMLEQVAPLGLALDQRVLAARPVAGSATGMMHDSQTGMYLLAQGIQREIAVGGTQSIHPSAVERWQSDRRYRPAGLAKWMG